MAKAAPRTQENVDQLAKLKAAGVELSSSFAALDRVLQQEAAQKAVAAKEEAEASADFRRSLLSGADAVLGLGQTVGPFVQALNPSLMLQFSQALYDLNAVVGLALQPVMQAFTEVTRAVADALVPIAEMIAPALADVMEALLPVVTDLVEMFADLIQSALEPLLPIVVGLVRIFGDMLRAVTIVVSALVGVLGDALKGSGDSMKEMMEGLRAGIQKFISYMVQALAAIAKFFGMTGLVERMAEGAHKAAGTAPVGAHGFQRQIFGMGLAGGAAAAGGGDEGGGFMGLVRKHASTGMGAATGAHFTDFASFGKEMATAASTAGLGKETKKTQEAWLEDLANKLDDIASGNRTLGDVILDAIKEAWAWIKGGGGLDIKVNALPLEQDAEDEKHRMKRMKRAWGGAKEDD